MKQILIFSLVLIILIGCKPKLTKDKLEGLWYDEERREELMFMGDSLKGHWSFYQYKLDSSGVNLILGEERDNYEYEIDGNDIIVKYNEDRKEYYQYIFERDTLFIEDTIRWDRQGQYVKIPHRSTLEYEIEKKGLEIDFFEGAISPDRLYSTKGLSQSQKIYFGKSIENDDELVLYFNRGIIRNEIEKSLNDALTFNHSRNSHVSNTAIFYLDKNIPFKEYARVKNMLLAHDVRKAKFITLRQNLPYPNYDFHHYFPGSFLWSEIEKDSFYIKYDTMPLPPPGPPNIKIEESINSYFSNPIRISWNDEGIVTVDGELVLNENLEKVLKEKYLLNTKKTMFIYKPSPGSKVETYLFVRNTVFKVHEDIKEKYALENYDASFSFLDRDTQNLILREYSLFQALDNWEQN